jgi:hypothetical protein
MVTCSLCISFVLNPPDDDLSRSKHVMAEYNRNQINTYTFVYFYVIVK